ncbi:hypothetical protein NQZ68_007259 [Dissostichus eleginoides]|nr:hypothetical protein NQZ68_007259 [Dissostichus eleginoides]
MEHLSAEGQHSSELALDTISYGPLDLYSQVGNGFKTAVLIASRWPRAESKNRTSLVHAVRNNGADLDLTGSLFSPTLRTGPSAAGGMLLAACRRS